MIIRTAFAITFSCLATLAVAQSIAPGKLYHSELLDVHAPNSTGWKLITSSGSTLAFARTGPSSDESYAAQADLFAMGETKSQEEFVAFIKKGVEADSPPDRFKTIESHYDYSEQRGYPCVKVTSIIEDMKRKASLFSKEGLKFQLISLYCHHPKQPKTGFSAAFSHRGTELDPELKSAAQSFIDAVQVPEK